MFFTLSVIIIQIVSIEKRIEAFEKPCENKGYKVLEYGKGLTNCGDTIPIPPINPLNSERQLYDTN